jgi:hypothetical protein
VKRERRLEGGLAKLRKLCIEVGADDTEVAASIHPSLRNFHEVMRGQYYTLSKPNVDAGDSKGEPVALTESVFTSLDARLEEIAADKTEREAALGEIREVLISMWTSVGISEDDENRKFFARLLTSSARLHSSTHEKVRHWAYGSPRMGSGSLKAFVQALKSSCMLVGTCDSKPTVSRLANYFCVA